MKTSVIFLLSLFLVDALVSCQNEHPPQSHLPSGPCSDSLQLGLFVTDPSGPMELFPLDGYDLDCSSPIIFSGISVNNPGTVEWFDISLKDTLSGSSDCLTTGEEIQYHWKVAGQKGLTAVLTTNSQTGEQHILYFMVLETPVLHPDTPENGPVGYYRIFTVTDKPPSTAVHQPFMTIMTEEKLPGQGAAFEHGYDFFPSIVLNGKTIYDVYSNIDPLPEGINTIFYSLTEGVVGVIDLYGYEHVR